MEHLTEKVYECTLGVEAHMICDLLVRAGISARVDGEFLQGAGGELPLGNSIKVRVAPGRAAEAREVIADWEKLQPPESPTPPPKAAPWRSPLWFVTGLVVGAGVGFALTAQLVRNPITAEGVDFDDDGDYEITYRYEGSRHAGTTIDSNNDGKIDVRYVMTMNGLTDREDSDNDFDGRFETGTQFRDELPALSRIDRDGDGRDEEIWHYEFGLPVRADYYDETAARLVSRQHFRAGERVSAEFDRDGDGVFEERVEFDRLNMPVR